MKTKFVLIMFCAGLSSVSHATNFEKFSEWKNRPNEKFSRAEESFKTAMDRLLQDYVDKGLTKEDLYRAATAGMLESLNPGDRSWNTLLSPQELQELQIDFSGKVSGIGVELKFDETTGHAQVIGVIPNSPSEKAGLRREDQILSVNGQRFKGRQFRDIVAALRGKTGETAALKVLREDSILSINVKREVIPWTPVQLSKIDGSTLLLTIGYFSAETPKIVEEKMPAINGSDVKNLVIDLRGNSGGSFEKAVQTAELFIPSGKTIVSTKDREGKVKTYTSKKGLLRPQIKVVLLTNGETSSGAELVTGALKENLGAKSVGESTLGKWNAQMIETLPNGFAIKYTTQTFQTPSGRSYENTGIKPDVEVALAKHLEPRVSRSKVDGAKRLEWDAQLKAAVELLGGQ